MGYPPRLNTREKCRFHFPDFLSYFPGKLWEQKKIFFLMFFFPSFRSHIINDKQQNMEELFEICSWRYWWWDVLILLFRHNNILWCEKVWESARKWWVWVALQLRLLLLLLITVLHRLRGKRFVSVCKIRFWLVSSSIWGK